MGEGYLYAAEMDLLAAKILHKNKIENLAVYHLQQAVEKMAKGACLLVPFPTRSGKVETILTYEQVSREHDLMRLIDTMLKRIKKLFVSSGNEELKFLSELIEARRKQINEQKRNVSGKESKEEIEKHIIRRIDDVRDKKQVPIREFQKIKEQHMKSPKWAGKELKTIDKVIKALKEGKFEKFTAYPSFVFFLEVFPVLALLGVTVFRHYSSTRYPDSQERISPRDYNEGNLGIVSVLDKLIEISEETLKKIKSNFVTGLQ